MRSVKTSIVGSVVSRDAPARPATQPRLIVYMITIGRGTARHLPLVRDEDGFVPRRAFLSARNAVRYRPPNAEQMTAFGVRREKAALSSGCEAHPAIRSRRKRSEQSWR